jgi:nicotinamide riboside transporter PnuC
LRGVHDLTQGDLGAALSSNLLFFALVAPVMVVAWVLWARRAWNGEEASPLRMGRGARAALVVAAVTLTVVFTVLRNSDPGAWLAP